MNSIEKKINYLQMLLSKKFTLGQGEKITQILNEISDLKHKVYIKNKRLKKIKKIVSLISL